MTLPKIAISIVTFNRPKEFATVIESIFQKLIYPKDLVTLVISDDRSDTDYVSDYKGFYGNTVVIKRTERGGLPVNWNGAIKEASKHGEYLWLAQDDWLHTEPVDLRLAVRFMQANQEIGAVRYHKLAGHVGLPSVIRQWNTRQSGIIGYSDSPHDYDPALCSWLELLPPFDGSNTYSPYSGGVHFRHVAFTDFYGEYEEGLKFSHAELKYFERVNSALRENLNICPRFAMFPHYITARFKDISAASYRDTQVELETLK